MYVFMKLATLYVVIVFITTFSHKVNSEQITVVTEHFPPYQVVEQGQPLSGLAVEFVQALLTETNTQADIQAYPWARAYKMAQYLPNTLIFSITRTAERENLFHWVGAFNHISDGLWVLKSDKNIQVSTLEDAKKYTVVVPRNDNTHNYLLKNGFKERRNLHVVNTREQAVKMLFNHRVDLLMSSQLLLEDRVKSLKLDFNEVDNILNIPAENDGLSIAFSKGTSLHLVAKFRVAFNKLKKQPRFKAIFSS